MKFYFLLPGVALFSLRLMSLAIAEPNSVADIKSDRKLLIQQLKSATHRQEQKTVELSEVTFPSTKAQLLAHTKLRSNIVE